MQSTQKSHNGQSRQNVQDASSIAPPRRPRRRITGRTALVLLGAFAPLAWAALLLFTYFIPPRGIPAFAIFFILLYVALTCVLVPLAYVIGARLLRSQLYRTTIRHALRQGALLSLLIVFNLLLRALNSWSLFTAIVSLAIVVVIEVLALARK
jgi:hypothetical protein